jgi:uncharacterized metal-binding protein YceD (DUF177 family)
MTGSRLPGGPYRSMLLDLSKLHRREHVERTFQPSAFEPPDDEYRVVAPVELVLDVHKLGADAFGVAGRVRTTLQLECGRCVDPFEVPVDATFDHRYVPHTQNTGVG